MPEMTYPKDSDKPVRAKAGTCDGCGERKPIVMVSNWGNYCTACSENLWKQWQERNETTWEERTRVMRDPETDEPFTLRDDGKP